MTLAIITARGGSKRIPRKNIRPFCGIPMIVRTIGVARESGCFEQVVVSTDDEEIAAWSRQAGASVPFMRSASLADDYTGTGPVVIDAIERLASLGIEANYYCCLYPTTPLLQAHDLREGLSLLRDNRVPFVFSIGSYGHPIQRALQMDSQHRIRPFLPENMRRRSQDLEPAYHDAGQFYWGTSTAWKTGVSVFNGASIGYLMPRNRLVDIDTEEDWLLAEALFKAARLT